MVMKRGTATVSRQELLEALEQAPPRRDPMRPDVDNSKILRPRTARRALRTGAGGKASRWPMETSICCTSATCVIAGSKGLGGKLGRRRQFRRIRARTQGRRPSGDAGSERAEFVAALAEVDAVVILPELDVRAIIREIRPNVQAKGTDYTADTVPERDAVEEYGGPTIVGDHPKNHYDKPRSSAPASARQP